VRNVGHGSITDHNNSNFKRREQNANNFEHFKAASNFSATNDIKITQLTNDHSASKLIEGLSLGSQLPQEYITILEYQAKSIDAINIYNTKSECAGQDKEYIESDYDQLFYKFSIEISKNPTQILRYRRNGRSLAFTTKDFNGKELSDKNDKSLYDLFGECRLCMSVRMFKSLLIPYLNEEFKEYIYCEGFEIPSALSDSKDATNIVKDEQRNSAGFEWRTIIIACCSKDCHEPTYSKIQYIEECTFIFEIL
jgi:hypothetical protein